MTGQASSRGLRWASGRRSAFVVLARGEGPLEKLYAYGTKKDCDHEYPYDAADHQSPGSMGAGVFLRGFRPLIDRLIATGLGKVRIVQHSDR
jgi:hypothetical protein